MRKKYLNKTGNKMNLQIERYLTIPVSIGIGLYEEKIANKFPSIFKPIKEKVVEEGILEENKVPSDFYKNFEVVDKTLEEIKELEKKIENPEVNEVNYARMTYQELKAMIRNRKIEIDGRKTSRKMIDALESNDEK